MHARVCLMHLPALRNPASLLSAGQTSQSPVSISSRMPLLKTDTVSRWAVFTIISDDWVPHDRSLGMLGTSATQRVCLEKIVSLLNEIRKAGVEGGGVDAGSDTRRPCSRSCACSTSWCPWSSTASTISPDGISPMLVKCRYSVGTSDHPVPKLTSHFRAKRPSAGRK